MDTRVLDTRDIVCRLREYLNRGYYDDYRIAPLVENKSNQEIRCMLNSIEKELNIMLS